MEKLKFVLLAVDNNDYQVEQVSAAQTAGARLGVELQIVHTEHDSIQQSQVVLDLVQSPTDRRPNAIFFEPVGTALAQPARAAAAAKVGWVILNRENVDYVRELRDRYSTPMFCVTTSHRESVRSRANRLDAFFRKAARSSTSKVQVTTMLLFAVQRAC